MRRELLRHEHCTRSVLEPHCEQSVQSSVRDYPVIALAEASSRTGPTLQPALLAAGAIRWTSSLPWMRKRFLLVCSCKRKKYICLQTDADSPRGKATENTPLKREISEGNDECVNRKFYWCCLFIKCSYFCIYCIFMR